MTWDELSQTISEMPPERRKNEVYVFHTGDFYPILKIRQGMELEEDGGEEFYYLSTV